MRFLANVRADSMYERPASDFGRASHQSGADPYAHSLDVAKVVTEDIALAGAWCQ
ncbi:hypothetical protein LTR28_000436, partial [Elasticomyces elasticus]